MGDRIKVLFVTPETVPYAATGGLADVAQALPEALHDQNVEVIRLMPKYKGMEERYPLKHVFNFIVETGGRANVASVFVMEEKGITNYFIGNSHYFDRDNFYGYGDDDERFGFFCKSALEMLMFLNLRPDIIHLNDWQTALIGLLLKQEYSHLDLYKDIKMVFTIHNLQYQGVFGKDALDDLNLSPKYFNIEAIEYYGKVCYMKAGIVYADMVTTVSKSYAKEIQTPWYGYGLDGLLRKYSEKIQGIVNGIHYSSYNPETDPALARNFSADNFRELKKQQKYVFQQEQGLPVGDTPLIGVVTRLAEQKGIDLILYAMEHLMNDDVQFVILGNGDYHYESRLLELQEKHPDKVKANIMFNQALSRKIYGSIDMFLMPSLFEPCGLSQLYSLRYGAVPIVRKTGGLGDTITDYHEDYENSTGFLFKNYNGHEFLAAVTRGLEVYRNQGEWEMLVERGMRKRFSWEQSAQEYIRIYNEVLSI
ncbi:glycogen synthase [Anaerotalea alkaliphila]|uniref:Glycogen synthase n=1 Tax=Anaerotalea alkaliphila TaxID=2662126 RepID=A0A7X5KMP7_9FIRM|nr:glycogen/starch synthase [Anaerotalea alkaliphila]NDL68059.1 glycogen synthase [Anaerotalea alkaliphila]